MISRLQWLLLALVVGATLILTWRWEFEPAQEATGERSTSGPDLLMEGAVIDQFDDAGALRYRLTARAIAHYPENGVTRVREPVLALLQAGSPPWEARARFGEVHSSSTDSAGNLGSDTVQLSNGVELKQTRGARVVRMRTERLMIRPLAKTAYTDLPVIIDSDTGRTVAAGMRGELETGRIALSSSQQQRVTTVVQARSI